MESVPCMKDGSFVSLMPRTLIALVLALGVAWLFPADAPSQRRETQAPPRTMSGPVYGQVLRVIDGDTLVVSARVWLGVTIYTRVRLRGIDAPERRGRCAAERRMAEKARARMADLVKGRTVRLQNIRYGKYAGRILAKVRLADGQDVGAILLDEGLAQRWRGRRRDYWCLDRSREN